MSPLRTVLLSSLLLLASGCVERRLLVRSDPPGAAIYVDGAYLGEAPVELPFDTYGTRTVLARRPGYTPVRRLVALDPPWYQYFPFDLVTDLLWPGTIHDVHDVTVRLERRGEPADPEALERRAERFGASEARRP